MTKIKVFPMFITMANSVDLFFVVFMSWLIFEGMLWLFKTAITVSVLILKIGTSS